jgi:hypothetical protein
LKENIIPLLPRDCKTLLLDIEGSFILNESTVTFCYFHLVDSTNASSESRLYF